MPRKMKEYFPDEQTLRRVRRKLSDGNLSGGNPAYVNRRVANGSAGAGNKPGGRLNVATPNFPPGWKARNTRELSWREQLPLAIAAECRSPVG